MTGVAVEGPEAPEGAALDDAGRALLLASVFLVAVCGLVYELVAGAVASYLLGDSVTQYSLVIGVFLAAMGIGSWLTQWVTSRELETFLAVELLVGLIGGFSAMFLFVGFGLELGLRELVLGFCLVVGTLVGMEIPLLLRILKGRSALRIAVARVLALDYLGALVASVLFPFLLLPRLGLVRAALLFGLLNVLVALLGILLFRDDLRARRALPAAAVLSVGLLLAGVAAAERTTTWLEDRLYQDAVVWAETSEYQRIVLTRWRDDVRLFLDGHLQFASADEYRYHEPLVWPAMLSAGADEGRVRRVLVLGGGDGLVARQVFSFPGVERIDLVDLDPRVVELFRDRPELQRINDSSLLDPRLEHHAADAFTWLRDEAGDRRWDVIVADLPDPGRPETQKLYTRGFYGMALRHLAPGGAFVTQATSAYWAPEAFWCVVETIEAAAEDLSRGAAPWSIRPYHAPVPSFGDWGFVLATREEGEIPAPEREGRFLTSAVLDSLFVFPPDQLRRDVEPNTLDGAVLVEYYRRGWDRWNE